MLFRSEIAALAARIAGDWTGTPVIAIAAHPSVDQLRQLMRAGVVDVVVPPVYASDLRTAVQHAAQALSRLAAEGPPAAAPAAPGGQVVTVLRAGGGAGATSILTQGAVVAARRKAGRLRIAVLDLDLQFGNAALYLDLEPRATGLPHLIEDPDRLDGALLSSAMARHASGVDVLAAPGEMLPMEAMTPDFVEALIRVARETYDLVLVDLPGAWTDWSYTALARSDRILLVGQHTVAGVRRAGRQLQTLVHHNLADKRLQLVMNRFDGGLFQNRKLRDAEQALGRKIDFCVPNDFEAVAEALNTGTPLAEASRRHPIVKALDRLVGPVEPAKADPALRCA